MAECSYNVNDNHSISLCSFVGSQQTRKSVGFVHGRLRKQIRIHGGDTHKAQGRQRSPSSQHLWRGDARAGFATQPVKAPRTPPVTTARLFRRLHGKSRSTFPYTFPVYTTGGLDRWMPVAGCCLLRISGVGVPIHYWRDTLLIRYYSYVSASHSIPSISSRSERRAARHVVKEGKARHTDDNRCSRVLFGAPPTAAFSAAFVVPTIAPSLSPSSDASPTAATAASTTSAPPAATSSSTRLLPCELQREGTMLTRLLPRLLSREERGSLLTTSFERTRAAAKIART